MKLLYWVFAATLVVAAVLFAVSNRQLVEFGYWPLPYTVEVPAFGFGLGAFGIGFLSGGFLVWLRGIGTRARARANARRADRLQRQVDTLQEQRRDADARTEKGGAVIAISDAAQPLKKSAGAH